MNAPQSVTQTHSWLTLYTAYFAVLIPMLVGLVRTRARVKSYLSVPLMSVTILLVALCINAILDLILEHVGVSSGGIVETLIALASFFFWGYRGGLVLAEEPADECSHRRGAIVSSAFLGSKAQGFSRIKGRRTDPADPNSPVTLAGVPVPLPDEVKHFKFIGTTGTGKSTAISELLAAALARGDRAIIADPDGGYLARFYDPTRGDVILNPFEADSVKWSLLEEITNDYDVDQVARSLIPEGSGSDRTWSDYARTFFIAVVRRTLEAGIKDDAEVFRLITKAPIEELKLLAKDTIAGPFLEDGNEKMFGSLRSVTAAAVRGLDYTTKGHGTAFSVRRWVRDGASRSAGGRGGVLFLPYKAGEIAALKSMISAWMRIAIFEAMSQPEGDQRLWFVIDELDALGEIDGLKDALARLRKFGGRCLLGLQSISQMSGVYGKAIADTIVENCANTLILRCSASEQGGTSQFASRLIGQREVIYKTHSQTRQPDAWFASRTTSEHRAVEHVIMASEIERLADLQGYLKLASTPDWYRVALSRVEYVGRPRPMREAGTGAVAGRDGARQSAPVKSGVVVASAEVVQTAESEWGAKPAREGESVRAAKPGVVKRPRKVAVKAAESNAVGEMPEVSGAHDVAAPAAAAQLVLRADAAPPSSE